MSESSLWRLSACALSELIQKREVSSVEAASAAIERMNEKNPHLNAVVADMADSALAEAAKLDEHMASSGPVGPLHGVPITIKENVDQTGCATTNGVTAFKDIIAPANSPVVNNLKNAGAIVIGRTNTPEFSYRGTTTNELHGRTYNPWNDWASPGGSSGGASSAVMAGMGAIAHGNDIGGSLRYPATATGAATVKPGLGRVPAYNPTAPGERGMLSQVMSTQGAIAREVKDVRLAMKSLITYDAHDPWMVPMPFEGPAEDGPIKVAFTSDPFQFDLHPAVDKALRTAKDALADAGYEIHEVDPPSVAGIAKEGAQALFGEATALLLNDVRKYGSEEFNKIFDAYGEYFTPFEGNDLLLAMANRSHHIRQWLLFLQDYPLVLTPFLLAPTFKWNRDTEGREGIEEVMGAAMYSISMNYMGLPAGNIPANYNDGLPVGVQIVGRRFREDMILDACEAIETRVGVMAERLFERG
ncbi:MAG: amidase family protein [Pikeienuella sp.]